LDLDYQLGLLEPFVEYLVFSLELGDPLGQGIPRLCLTSSLARRQALD
jgi:hypothetical protein